jgi:hypothetical protein
MSYKLWGSLRMNTKGSLFGSMNSPSISRTPSILKLVYRVLDQRLPQTLNLWTIASICWLSKLQSRQEGTKQNEPGMADFKSQGQ